MMTYARAMREIRASNQDIAGWLMRELACTEAVLWVARIAPKSFEELWERLSQVDWICWYISHIEIRRRRRGPMFRAMLQICVHSLVNHWNSVDPHVREMYADQYSILVELIRLVEAPSIDTLKIREATVRLEDTGGSARYGGAKLRQLLDGEGFGVYYKPLLSAAEIKAYFPKPPIPKVK